jgi:hypothetical protein
MEAPPSPLSSRPKRSEVEGSAVRPSPLPTSHSQTSTPNRGVIPTGAQRSGGTCCSSSVPSNLNGSATLSFVIPTGPQRSGGICSSADPSWKCFRQAYWVVPTIRERRAVASTRPEKAPRWQPEHGQSTGPVFSVYRNETCSHPSIQKALKIPLVLMPTGR